MSDEDRHVVDVYLEKIYGKYFLRNTFLRFSINEWEIATPNDSNTIILYTNLNKSKQSHKIYWISRTAATSQYLSSECKMLAHSSTAHTMIETCLGSGKSSWMITCVYRNGSIVSNMPESQLFQLTPIRLMNRSIELIQKHEILEKHGVHHLNMNTHTMMCTHTMMWSSVWSTMYTTVGNFQAHSMHGFRCFRFRDKNSEDSIHN